MASRRKAAAVTAIVDAMAPSDGGGASSGTGTVTRKSARRAAPLTVLVQLRHGAGIPVLDLVEMAAHEIVGVASGVVDFGDSNAVLDLVEMAAHEIVGVASGVVDFGDSNARVDDLRHVPQSLLKRFRDTVSTLESIIESIHQSPRPRLWFQLDAFRFPEGRNGQA